MQKTMSLSQRIQRVTAAKKNICLRMRMVTVAHNSNGSLITIWIGGLTPLEGNNPLALNIASKSLTTQGEDAKRKRTNLY